MIANRPAIPARSTAANSQLMTAPAEEMNGPGHELACVVAEFAVAPSRSAVHTSTAHGHADGDRPAHRARDLPVGRRDDFDPDERHSQQQHRRHRPQAPLVAAGLRSGSVRHRTSIGDGRQRNEGVRNANDGLPAGAAGLSLAAIGPIVGLRQSIERLSRGWARS